MSLHMCVSLFERSKKSSQLLPGEELQEYPSNSGISIRYKGRFAAEG